MQAGGKVVYDGYANYRIYAGRPLEAAPLPGCWTFDGFSNVFHGLPVDPDWVFQCVSMFFMVFHGFSWGSPREPSWY